MNYEVLNSVFSKKTFISSAEGDNCFLFDCLSLFKLGDVATIQDAYDRFFSILSKKYRNEYFYKTKIFEKLIISKHKLLSTKIITELNVGNSIADFVTINGKMIMYEIKTELDTLDRLENQIKDYYRVTPYVVLVVSDCHLKNIQRFVDNYPVGVYYLSKRGSVKTLREPTPCFNYLNPSTMFRLLRKKEYESIILKELKSLPSCDSFSYYSQCEQLFKKLNSIVIYKYLIKSFKERILVNPEIIMRCHKSTRLLIYLSKDQESVYKNISK